jgi:hypothetical protein
LLQPWGVNYRAHTVLGNVSDIKHYRARVPSSGVRDSERKVRTLKMMPAGGGGASAQNPETAAEIRELMVSD